MKIVRTIMLIGVMLLPGMVLASTNCRIIEYPDHDEVVCVGEAQNTISPPQIPVQSPTTAPSQIITREQTPEREQTLVPSLTAEQEQTPDQIQFFVQSPTIIQTQTRVPEQSPAQSQIVAQAPAPVQVQTDDGRDMIIVNNNRSFGAYRVRKSQQ